MVFLPCLENITEDQINSILVILNISGKKKWDPADEAGWLWRLFHDENQTVDQLARKFGLKQTRIKNYIQTYQFMIDNNLTDHSQFSSWLVLNTNKHIKKLRKTS